MFDNIVGFLKFVVPMILTMVLVVGSLVGIGIWFDITYEQNQCRTMESLHDEYEFKWVLWGGCLVKTHSGYWVNSDDYLHFEGDLP